MLSWIFHDSYCILVFVLSRIILYFIFIPETLWKPINFLSSWTIQIVVHCCTLFWVFYSNCERVSCILCCIVFDVGEAVKAACLAVSFNLISFSNEYQSGLHGIKIGQNKVKIYVLVLLQLEFRIYTLLLLVIDIW